MAGKKILVADDSLTIQKVIRLALSNEGYEIQAVSDGNDAIQQISLFRPNIVLIDVSLPGKTAFEVKREINHHEDLREVRFVLMSSAFEKVDEEQVQEVQFHGSLTKPFDPANLRQVLTDVLAQVTAKEKTSTPSPPLFEITPPPIPSSISLHDPMDDSEEALKDSIYEAEILPPPPPNIKNSIPIETAENWAEAVQPNLPTFPNPPQDFLFDNPFNEKFNGEFGELGELKNEFNEKPLAGLWDSDVTASDLIPPPPPLSTPKEMPPPPPLPSQGPDSFIESDIRELTESTLRITRMDDFQWSVNEPTLKPLPQMLDRGNSNFEMEPPPRNLSSEMITLSLDDPKSEDPQTQPSFPSFTPTPPPPVRPATQKANASLATPPFTSSSSVSQEQMEALIRSEVQAALEKMVQKILPEIAERLIKQEIFKMLSE